jgi:demethylmenaquinone methyltransferase/2-methoxy-6-polyprenyl-1,4-benzoquinol methylase
MSRASLDKQPHEVAQMFDGVGKRYDLTNTILSFGQDRTWRRETTKALKLQPGETVLDLAAGTAVSTEELAKSGAFCVAADFSLGMLAAGAKRDLPKVAADGLHLPFADASFDAVTVSFGLRNMQDTVAALQEMARVTKPGGRIVVCEFSRPTFAPFRAVYLNYLMRFLPPIARKVSSNGEAYAYLAESIRAWPAQAELAALLQAAGWEKVRWRDLTGGISALHYGVKP